MSVIKKIKNKSNFLRQFTSRLQLELETYCFEDVNYLFALQLCNLCVAFDAADILHKQGIVYFGHLLTSYRNHTHEAVKNILDKYKKGFYRDLNLYQSLGAGSISFLEYMTNQALNHNDNENTHEWQFVRDKIEILSKFQVETHVVAKELTNKELQRIERWQKNLAKYNRAARYLIENILSYTQYPVEFALANEICRSCLFSSNEIVSANAIFGIGYLARYYKQMPDADLVKELANFYYNQSNIYYKDYIVDADRALHVIETHLKLEVRPPKLRGDLVEFYLEQVNNKEKIHQDADEDQDNDATWFIINELVVHLQKCQLWDQDPSSKLGMLFINQEEVDIITPVIHVLKKLIANIGEKKDNASYLQAPEFAELMQVAGQAHQVLLANDEEFKKIYFK